MPNSNTSEATTTEHAPRRILPLVTPLATTETLLAVVGELSHARTLESITEVVRKMARQLLDCEGVTFVLREGDCCHYADEDAIEPLWKGKRFPMSTCVSGWVMEHGESIIIPDIYADERVPADAYRPTFVKSLAMVPIRRQQPIGAIGAYWASYHEASPQQLMILQALADSVSVAMENVALYSELQSKLQALQESNHELSRFAWLATRDLHQPLNTIGHEVEQLAVHALNQLDERSRQHIRTATAAARQLRHLAEDMMAHARLERSEHFKPVVMGELLKEVLRDMQLAIIESGATVTNGELPWIWGDRMLLARLLQNLLDNAVKFRREGVLPTIHVDCRRMGEHWHFVVSDNGIGIAEGKRTRIFEPFQRVHADARYGGSGLGLATARKIVEAHRGRIWVDSEPGVGSTFHVQLPAEGGAVE